MGWDRMGWEPFITNDGSPTLRYLSDEQQELMHHSGGAFAESHYIYGRILSLCSEIRTNPVVMSLGLGLGYNELLTAQFYISGDQSFLIHSYEKDPFLNESLLKALGVLPNDLASEIQHTYELAFSFFKPESKAVLKRAYFEKRWHLHGPLSPNDYAKEKVNLFFWDAFSRKTSPELWDEAFLVRLLSELADSDVSFLSTYACNGPIQRALRANHFEVIKTKGFQNKRQSILAKRIRGSGSDLNNV